MGTLASEPSELAERRTAGIVRRLVWRIKFGDRSRVLDMAGGDF